MGSKEEKHIVIEFQKKILQEAGCSAEVIAFLDEIEDEVFCEYYCFCFLVSTFFKTGTIAKPMITSRMMIAIGREKKYGMSPPFGAAMIKVLRKLDSKISARTTPRTRGAGSNP